MPRILVIANQTIGGPELREEVRKRVQGGQCSFYVLVPNTAAAHYHVVPAAGGFVPMPSIALDYGGPPADEEATEGAKGGVSQKLAARAGLGAGGGGRLGGADTSAGAPGLP